MDKRRILPLVHTVGYRRLRILGRLVYVCEAGIC
jgi:hypothetical protein